MPKILKLLPFLLLFSVFSAAAEFEKDLTLESAARQEVPAPPEASAIDRTAPDYGGYLAALSYYSDVAYKGVPGTEAYLEASIAGDYLRGKVDEIETGLRAAGKPIPSEGVPGRDCLPSEKVMAELRGVFGFGTGGDRGEPVSIKKGFAKIVYVKGTTPFLVQEDSFLNKGEVILTFDDGPAPGEYSREVADNLKANSAQAAFFVLGEKLGSSGKAMIKAEAEDGHFVSVHGYHHATETGKPFTAYTTEKTLDQLGRVAGSIIAATGVKPALFRPPYGVIGADALKAVIADLNLAPLGWTIDTMDWSIKSPDELYAKTIALIKQRGKGIILMHDIHPQSRETAKRLLQWFKENNYKVVSPDRIVQAFQAQ
ncbi:MAG: polysaccharide deacetylase family protein [Elusimicrobia bacterium]|nr:polysaccharide deacetylase family protein [Elusimicrobiota bacterium]